MKPGEKERRGEKEEKIARWWRGRGLDFPLLSHFISFINLHGSCIYLSQVPTASLESWVELKTLKSGAEMRWCTWVRPNMRGFLNYYFLIMQLNLLVRMSLFFSNILATWKPAVLIILQYCKKNVLLLLISILQCSNRCFRITLIF